MTKTIFKTIKCLAILFLTCSCSMPKFKTHPEYVGVDPKAQKILNEYMWLSKQHQIEFNNVVTIGFKNIDEGNAVGLCNYGGYFREIDVDINYWNHSTNTTHTALLFHELTHCYCNRDHDYGKRSKYPETELGRKIIEIYRLILKVPKPGFWKDGCPMSLMHPIVVDDGCMINHYDQYVKEMFDRCDPF